MKIDNAVIFARKFTYIYCKWICFCRDNEKQISWLQTSFLHLFSFLGKLPNWGMDTVFLHQIILYALLWSRHTKIFLLVPIVTEMRKVKCFSAILVVSQLVIFVWHKFIISINQRQKFWRFYTSFFAKSGSLYLYGPK